MPSSSSEDKLRASEFAAILNGDNPQGILRVLKQFVKTVRSERRWAMSQEEDVSASEENDDTSMDDNDNNTLDNDDEDPSKEPPTKKYKKSEQWKVDTADYNVPFVGTAVARGDVAEVKKGEWPTGMVKEYLEKSPLAVELLNEDLRAPNGQLHKSLFRKNRRKLSTSISKAHCLALAELLTAAIPKEKLDECSLKYNDLTPTNLPQTRFIQEFTKGTFPWIFELLNEDTGKGRGKTGVKGGCGPIVAPAFRVLQNYTMISTTNARLVARHLDESLSGGVLRSCLRPMHVKKESAEEDVEASPQKPARAEAIRLGTCLLNSDDAATNAYICTSGSRERKINPGIVYIAVREGIEASSSHQVHDNDDANYCDSVADMFQSTRRLLFQGSTTSGNSRLLHDLISRDPLQHLTKITSRAPALTSESGFRAVLDASDAYGTTLEAFENMGIEARRLLFPLLSDTFRSPLLLRRESNQIVRAMIQLLEATSDNIELHHFVIYCLVESPFLLGELFTMLNVPDPQKGFEFIARVRLIASILKTGPSVLDCLLSSRDQAKSAAIEEIVPVLFPNKLRTQHISKSLLSGSLIAAMEILKLIVCVFDRHCQLLSSKSDSYLVGQLSSSLRTLLPDIHVLLSLWNRLDPTKVSGAAVIDYLLKVIESYASTFPEYSTRAAADLMKLLPENFFEFTSFLPRVQIKFLTCIQTIVRRSQSHSTQLLLSSKALFSIMLSTKTKVVYDVCHDLIVELLGPALMPLGANDETQLYITHEASVWIDALTPSTLSFFFELIGGAPGPRSWPFLVSIGTAWKKYNVARAMNFSVLMAAALSNNDKSAESAVFVGQVVARCTFYLSDPIPLAAVVVVNSEVKNCIAGTSALAPLVDYAKALIDSGATNKSETEKALKRVVGAYYTKDSVQMHILEGLTGDFPSHYLEPISRQPGVLGLLKFLNHAFIVTRDDVELIKTYTSIVESLLPGLLLASLSCPKTKQIAIPVLENVSSIRSKFEDQSNFPSSIDFFVSLCRLSAFSASVGSIKLGGYPKSLGCLLPSRNGRLILMWYSVMAGNVSSSFLLEALIALVSNISHPEEYEKTLEIALRFQEISVSDQKFHIDKNLWEKLVACWLLGCNEAKTRCNSLLRRFKGFLCKIIVECSIKNDFDQSLLLSVLADHSEQAVVNACFDVVTDDPTSVPPEFKLLSFLIGRDCHRYYDGVATYTSQMDAGLNKLWNLGFLDAMALVCLESFLKVDSAVAEPWLEAFFPFITKRVIRILAEKDLSIINGSAVLFELASKALTVRRGFNLDLSDLESAVDQSLVDFHTWQVPALLVSPTMQGLCGLAASLIFGAESKRTALWSHLFSLLLTHLPAIMKKSKSIHHVPPGLSAGAAIQWLLDLLGQPAQQYSTDITKLLKAEIVEKSIRSCLKNGISTSASPSLLPSSSLGLVAKLLTWSFRLDCPIASSFPTPSDIFDKVIDHSKFQHLFMEQPDAKELSHIIETRKAVLKLMLDCLSLTSKEIQFLSTTWTIVLTPFKGGTGEYDTLIRQIANACSNDSCPFLDNFRFVGSLSFHSHGKTGISNRWEWFLEEMNPSRIRATIASFPVEETFFPRQHNQSDDQRDNRRNIPSSKVDLDKRYSPILFLGLLLGAMEGCITLRSTTDDDVSGSIYTNPSSVLDHTLHSVETVHQVCEKGAVGMCFMALCSTCKKMRLYAVACLGIIAQVAASEQAKELSSWRDRPQLVMILNSVRRGLSNLKSDSAKGDIPRILPIVANFLARASFVLARPDDPLYEAVNRYFLKSEAGHGAFQDFNRLPAFMSLFCSRASDSHQARAERLWALQSIRDGLMDAASFRVVASCHAPELILTSFENVRLSKVSHESQGMEYCLLLEALKAMLDYGGHAAHSHLIRRFGLLAWMHSLCTGELIHFFPTTRTAATFCGLVKATAIILKQSTQMRTALAMYEVCGLIEPLLGLCLLENGDAVIPAAINALKDLRTLIKLLEEEEPRLPPSSTQAGASLRSTLRVLKLVEGTSRESALDVLCGLPLSFASGVSQDDVDNFVLLSLGSCETRPTKTPGDDNCFITPVLRRIAVLLEYFRGLDRMTTMTLSHDILKKIFYLRSRLNFTHSKHLESLWRQCLQLAQEVYSQQDGDDWLASFLARVIFRDDNQE